MSRKQIIAIPSFFPPAYLFAITVLTERLIFDFSLNYQKKTYFNRVYLCNDYGKTHLSFPLNSGKTSLNIQEVTTSIDKELLTKHWRAIETNYSSSPYFEFYKDDLEVFFMNLSSNMLENNIKSYEFICDALNLDFNYSTTAIYQKEYNPEHFEDIRNLQFIKNIEQIDCQKRYIQVVSDKLEFIPHLSILDVLFNLGPEANNYLTSLLER